MTTRESTVNGIRGVLYIALAFLIIAGGFAFLFFRGENTRHEQHTTELILRGVTCGQANQTALAFRQPQQGESDEHFAERMRAQRITLRQAAGSSCGQIKGLGGFADRRLAALAEIRAVLRALHAGKHADAISVDGAGGADIGSAGTEPSDAASASPAPSATDGVHPAPSSGGGTTTGSSGGPGGGSVTVTTTPTPPTTTPPPQGGPVEHITHDVAQTVDDLGQDIDQVGCQLAPQTC